MLFYSNKMHLHFKNAVAYLTFPSLEKYSFINHAFSTRIGGVSSDEFTSMNLGWSRGDKEENVAKNYRRFCDAVGVEYETLVASKQDHGDYVLRVNRDDLGLGISKNHTIESVDALITNDPEVTLVTYFADCTPIFFLDPNKKVVALAHAGWRGTANKICKNVIDKMKNEFKSDAKDIICGVGPAIGQCCFEVDEEVCQKFKKLEKEVGGQFIENLSIDGKYMIDLLEANKKILMHNGVQEENISVSDLCTKCNSDLLISHRQTNGKRGTMVAMIQIKREV